MKVNYCPECGTKILEGVVFCGECGTKIFQKEEIVKIQINHCTSCAYSTKEDEKFCPECGSQMSKKADEIFISDDIPLQTQDIEKENYSYTPKKKSIKPKAKSINKPKRRKSSRSQPKYKESRGKKKGGFLSMVGKLVLGFVLFLIVGSIVLYNLDDEWEDSQRVLTEEYKNEETSVTPDQKNQTRTKLNESKSIKQVVSKVEEIFENADTTALKQILTETSLNTYKGVFSSIEPYMKEYAKAFKNRKLVAKTNMYSLYSFKDENGEKFTVAFAQVDKGVWKLVRF